MSEQEKERIIEAHLPSIQAIRDEYRTQGRALTAAEAEAIRAQLRQDLAAGHVDAMENILGDDALDKVTGGCPGPTPTKKPEDQDDEETDTGLLTYDSRDK